MKTNEILLFGTHLWVAQHSSSSSRKGGDYRGDVHEDFTMNQWWDVVRLAQEVFEQKGDAQASAGETDNNKDNSVLHRICQEAAQF